MIVPQPQAPSATYFGDIQANRVGIDTKNIDFVTSLLTTNLYSFPIQSFLRETISNGWDSHVEAGNKEPLIVTLDSSDPSYIQQIRDRYYAQPKSSCTITISIRDFGTGVSPERFNTIYRNIGSSTKRESNDYIGMFGIGRFSCLSCADSAVITSYHNNIKYSYLMYKDGKGINIDKLGEVKGEFKSGLEVSVTIAGTKDNIKDIEAGFQQLVFFEGVFLHDPHRILGCYAEIFNKRAVKQYNYFAVHSDSSDYAPIRLLVGNCTYPLNKDLWNIAFDHSQYPIYIKFDIGELDITPNREAILYNPKSEALIKQRIIQAAGEIHQMLIKDKWFEFTSLTAYIEFMQGYKVNFEFKEEDRLITKLEVTYNLCKKWGLSDSDITLCSKRTPAYFIKVISSLYGKQVPQSLLKFIFRDGKYFSVESEKKRITYKSLVYALENKKTHIICTNDSRWGLPIKQFVKDEILLDPAMHRYSYSSFDNGYVLNRDFIKTTLKSILKSSLILEKNGGYHKREVTSMLLHYLKSLPVIKVVDSTDIPDSYKALTISTTSTTVTPKIKKDREIAVGSFRHSDKYDYQESYYPPVRDCSILSWDKLQKTKKPFIYSSTNTEDIEDLKALYRLLSDVSQDEKFYFISVAPSVIPKIQALGKGKTVTEFIHSNNSILRKLVTVDKAIFQEVLGAPSRFSDGIEGLDAAKRLLNKYACYTNSSIHKTKQESVLNLWADIKKLYSKNCWYDFKIKTIQENSNLVKACKLMNAFRHIDLQSCFPLFYYIHQSKLAKLNSKGRKYLLLHKNY